MKANPAAPSEKGAYVQDVFRRIAPRYDLMNRLMTGGQDLSWRREVIRRAQIAPHDTVLDLGAGTGDLSREALHQQPACRPIAADFTLAMMQAGKFRPDSMALAWTGADALHLPFPDESVDVVISGFLLRNVSDLPAALREQIRVLRPGGRMVTLDTTRPQPTLLSPFIRFHMRRVIPFLGTALTGSRDAYVYLPTSSENFLLAEDLHQRIQAAGFVQTGFVRRMFGTVAIHWGQKARSA